LYKLFVHLSVRVVRDSTDNFLSKGCTCPHLPRVCPHAQPIFFPFLPLLPHTSFLRLRNRLPPLAHSLTPPPPPQHNTRPSHHVPHSPEPSHPSPPPPSPAAPRLSSSRTAHLPMAAVATAVPSPVLRPHRHTVAPTNAVIGVSLACIAFTTPSPPPPSRVSRPLSNVTAAQGSCSPSHRHANDDIIHGFSVLRPHRHAAPCSAAAGVCTLTPTPYLHLDLPLLQHGHRRGTGWPSAA
jgi:hypothetical protein